jgi:hypothetical protein
MRDLVKVLLVTLSLVGAGCGSSSGGKDLAKFEGVWSPASGTFTETCPGGSGTTTNQVTSALTWAGATTSDLVQTVPGTGGMCLLHANVSADTATAVAGSMCTINTPATATSDSFTDVLSITSYTFVISPDGMTATENYSGTDAETDNTANASGNCTFTQTASYTKQ